MSCRRPAALRSLLAVALFCALCWPSAGQARPITSAAAKRAAISETRRLHQNTGNLAVSVDRAPLTYPALLRKTPHSPVFRATIWRSLLGKRRFWLVRFSPHQNGAAATAESGSWVFVDANDGSVLSIHHWR